MRRLSTGQLLEDSIELVAHIRLEGRYEDKLDPTATAPPLKLQARSISFPPQQITINL